MNSLPQVLLGLLRLRAGPQDLPVSWSLTLIIMGAYFVEGILTSQALGADDGAARILLAGVIEIIAIIALLRWRGHAERLPQTLLAMALTGIVLGLISYLFLAQADPERNQPLLALTWFGVLFWRLAVEANIYRHAFAISLAQGVLVAVLILAASYTSIQFLFQ